MGGGSSSSTLVVSGNAKFPSKRPAGVSDESFGLGRGRVRWWPALCIIGVTPCIRGIGLVGAPGKFCRCGEQRRGRRREGGGEGGGGKQWEGPDPTVLAARVKALEEERAGLVSTCRRLQGRAEAASREVGFGLGITVTMSKGKCDIMVVVSGERRATVYARHVFFFLIVRLLLEFTVLYTRRTKRYCRCCTDTTAIATTTTTTTTTTSTTTATTTTTTTTNYYYYYGCCCYSYYYCYYRTTTIVQL